MRALGQLLLKLGFFGKVDAVNHWGRVAVRLANGSGFPWCFLSAMPATPS